MVRGDISRRRNPRSARAIPRQQPSRHRPAAPQIDDETAYAMLRTDFEQAFVVHNAYRSTEHSLYQLSLRIIAFPLLIIGALLSAGLIRSTERMGEIVQSPVIGLALITAAMLNTVVVRAHVSNDRVQTEAKHQVNRLRSLYLTALADRFPDGWKPVWGSTNPYLETNLKFKAAAFTSVLLGAINGLYVGYGTSALIGGHLLFAARLSLAAVVGTLYFVGQLEVVWQYGRGRTGQNRG